jgi:putative transposase
MSRGIRCTEDQIIKVLGEIEPGAGIASVARSHGIAEQTLCRWRERCAGMAKSELAELKALQEENCRLHFRGTGHRDIQTSQKLSPFSAFF